MARMYGCILGVSKSPRQAPAFSTTSTIFGPAMNLLATRYTRDSVQTNRFRLQIYMTLERDYAVKEYHYCSKIEELELLSLTKLTVTAKASWRAGPVGEPLFEHFRSLHHQLCHKRSIFYSI